VVVADPTELFYLEAAAMLLAQEQGSRPPDDVPDDYEGWLATFLPQHVRAPMADHHHRIWRWFWALQKGVRPETSLVGLLARGGGKSTTVELACAAVGARQTRKYVLYVCGVQPQADDHVSTIASMLESPTIAQYYPTLGKRLLNTFGSSKGWRRSRIRSEAGLTVDALGLDVLMRGVKLEEQRPDLIIFDDLDDRADSIETVKKKIVSITTKILPSGSSDVAVAFLQNVVHHEGIAGRLAGLASEEADFLADREVIGPIPAVIGLKTEPIPGTSNPVRHRITAGTPTWAGQDIPTCEAQIARIGLRAFMSEAQHEPPLPDTPAFPEFDRSVHVVEPFPIPEAWPKWRSVDYGYAVPYTCGWFTRSPQGRIYFYRETYATRKTAREQAYEIRILSGTEQYRFSVGDPAMWASQREGEKFQSVADHYGEMGVRLTQASNDRLTGKAAVHAALEWAPGVLPILQVFSTCHNFIRTLPMLPVDPHKPEDVDTTKEDHSYDMSRYSLMAVPWLNVSARREPRGYTVGGRR